MLEPNIVKPRLKLTKVELGIDRRYSAPARLNVMGQNTADDDTVNRGHRSEVRECVSEETEEVDSDVGSHSSNR